MMNGNEVVIDSDGAEDGVTRCLYHAVLTMLGFR